MSQATGDELAAMSSAAQAQPQATQNPDANDSSQVSQVSQPGANDTATTTVDADNNGSNDKPADNDEKSNDLPPKTEITLTLKATTEYNSFPFAVQSKNKPNKTKQKQNKKKNQFEFE